MSESDSLVNHPRLTEAFSHPEHNINLIRWKDIRFLTPPEQLRFWCCFAYLFIMPPKHLNHNKQPYWVYQTYNRDRRGNNQIYTPICRYDQFVASHATCCEHHTNYFAYYHRNLISQYVLALNEADYALREEESEVAIQLKQMMKKLGLLKQYSAAVQFYNQKVMIDVKKQLLQEDYALQQLPWVTPAYWNLFDYESDFQLPAFLTTKKPKQGENPILDLMKAYRHFQFGQFNFRETWNQGSDDLSYFWRARYTRIDYWEKNIIEGKSSRQEYMRFRNQLRFKIIQHNYGKFVKNLYERDNEGKRKCTSDLILLTNQQINFQYGGGKLKFFTEAESQNIDTIESANLSIPYYQYVKAILTPFEDFCIPSDSNINMNRDGFLAGNNSISLSHDLMHDNLGYPTSDASFSIMSPMFMLYHGFVQYMHEQYLRLIEKYDKQKAAYKSLKVFLDTPISIQNYRYTEIQKRQLESLKERIKIARRNNEVAQQRMLVDRFKGLKRRMRMEAPEKKYLQPGFGGFLAQFHQQNQRIFKTNGDYPIFQWTLTGPDYDQFTFDQTPLIEGIHYSAIGTYRQLMLNQSQTNIRYSNDLYSFYKKYAQELKIPQELLDEGYPFSYTFDLIEENSHKDPPIPDYLHRIQNDIEEGNIQADINTTLRTKVGGVQRPIVEPELTHAVKSGMKFLFRDSIEKKLGPSKVGSEIQELKFQELQNLEEMKFKRKIFLGQLQEFNSLYCRIQHQSNLQTVTIMLSMRIKNTATFQFNNSGSDTVGNKLQQKIINSNGLIGSYPYTVFGKSFLSATCPRCKPIKCQKFSVFKYMTGQLNPILLDLHVNAKIGILYDSRENQKDFEGRQKQIKFEEIVQVFHDFKKPGFIVQIISGAISVNFRVIHCEDFDYPEQIIPQNSNTKYQIRIIAENIDLRTKKMFASLQAKKKSINTQITFEEMSAPIQKNKYMKELVYKRFKVMLIIDYKTKPKEQSQKKGRRNSRREDKQQSGGDIQVINFEFEIPNFAIEAYYDILINKSHDILVIDSRFNQKMDIFF